MHSATHEQLEVIQSLQPMFEEHILPLLTPVDELWQPTDFLPDSRDQDQFYQEARGSGGWGERLVGGGLGLKTRRRQRLSGVRPAPRASCTCGSDRKCLTRCTARVAILGGRAWP